MAEYELASISENSSPEISINYELADDKSSLSYLYTRIARATVDYKDYDDGDTIQAFQEDFEGWTMDMLDRLPSEARKYFRDFVRAKGVYTEAKLGKISQQLYKLLDLDPDNLPGWNFDLKEIEIANTKSKSYRKQRELLSQSQQLK
ncbi:hypothetical protein GcC1_195025 [Golovinomyces cichoracearum]|uniref:Uncharacterized protein n=1 Tax=Golovinomyces cichoracearum TaxID=62708 RepID=A0A420HH46_9PEZI|nr:hypothetical protein GcC1_195025 [Golovinomyces cichoracearum]